MGQRATSTDRDNAYKSLGKEHAGEYDPRVGATSDSKQPLTWRMIQTGVPGPLSTAQIAWDYCRGCYCLPRAPSIGLGHSGIESELTRGNPSPISRPISSAHKPSAGLHALQDGANKTRMMRDTASL